MAIIKKYKADITIKKEVYIPAENKKMAKEIINKMIDNNVMNFIPENTDIEIKEVK